MASAPVAASAPPRVAGRLRTAPDGALRLLHAGADAVYAELDGGCVGVVSRHATQVPCALRTRLDALPRVGAVRVRGGVLHLDDAPVVVGRLVDVSVPRRRLALRPRPPEPAALVGAGAGLTPYGDDVLCGWLAVHRAAGVATPAVDAEVRRLLPRTTLLSATLLGCAMAGEVVPAFARWLRALGTDAEPDAERDLLAVGATSGRGLLEGARTAMSGAAA